MMMVMMTTMTLTTMVMSQGLAGAYKFMHGRATWVHCVCDAAEHALLQFEDNWHANMR
jgi:hypothetical protein